jgi:outer membrane immunogenic protein
MKKTTAGAAMLFALLVSTQAMAGEGRVEVRTGLNETKLSIPAANISEKASGLSYGIAAGYDFDIGEVMFVGAEASVDLTNAKVNIAGTPVKYGREIGVVARLGAKLGEQAKLYVLGGRANVKVSSGGDSDTGADTVLGAGLQYGLGKKAYLKTEYRRLVSKADANDAITGKFTDQRLLVGVGIRF